MRTQQRDLLAACAVLLLALQLAGALAEFRAPTKKWIKGMVV
jgi:hypothetical protein